MPITIKLNLLKKKILRTIRISVNIHTILKDKEIFLKKFNCV